eukprot:TRINITY_DN6855_c0_g1_i3.p1 TRINITY_DN6855_c0_g1~~TRINITY_DN6855_c0_g1_i3.p1  ORF type:complete len:876 (+),score=286.72 TRINITY_DN6855_c0_g1_i3:250-2877(+)
MAEPGYFIVDTSPWASPSGKPHHTEKRLATSPTRPSKLQEAAESRARHLARRMSSGQQAQAKIEHLQSQRDAELALQRSKIQSDLEEKEKRRIEMLEKRIQTLAEHDKHVEEVRLHAEQQEEEQRIAYAQRHLAKLRRFRKRRLSSSGGNPTLRSAPLDESWPPTQTAAVAIQRWYRLKQLKTVVDNLQASRVGKILNDPVEAESFEAVARALQDKESMLVAKELVRIFRRAAKKKGDKSKSKGKKRSPRGNEHRVLLTALMVNHHPEAIFDQQGELEEQLAQHSEKMLAVMQTWTQAVMAAKHRLDAELQDLNHAVSLAWLQYAHAFKMWSQRDRSMLVQGMVDHHAELCRLRTTVARQEDTPQADKWHPHIDEQLDDLEAKLRALGHTEEADQCNEHRCVMLAQQEKEQREQAERYRTVSEETSAFSTNEMSDDEGAEDVAASPTPVEQLPESLRNMWDASLLHQLAVDPSFKLGTEDEAVEDDAFMSLEQRIAQQTKRAVFDQMRQELAHPSDGVATLTAGLRQLVEDLQACTLPRQERLRNIIADQFDVALLAQQLTHGAFDLAAFKSLVQHHLSQLSAAQRDPDIALLAQHDNLVDLLEATLKLTSIVRLDLANFLLDQYRPVLRKHAVDVERQRIQEVISAGAMPLENTRAWLQQASKEAAAEQPHAPKRDDAGQASAATLYFAAVEKLLNGDSTDEEWPETFAIDKESMQKAAAGMHTCVTIAAMYTLIVAAVPSLKTNTSFAKVFATRSHIILDGVAEPLSKVDDIVQHAYSWVQLSGHEELDQTARDAVHARLTGLTNGHPVMQLMSRRAHDELRRRFQDETAGLKTNTGLDVVAKGLDKWIAVIARIAHHNKEVFAFLYDQMLMK